MFTRLLHIFLFKQVMKRKTWAGGEWKTSCGSFKNWHCRSINHSAALAERTNQSLNHLFEEHRCHLIHKQHNIYHYINPESKTWTGVHKLPRIYRYTTLEPADAFAERSIHAVQTSVKSIFGSLIFDWIVAWNKLKIIKTIQRTGWRSELSKKVIELLIDILYIEELIM